MANTRSLCLISNVVNSGSRCFSFQTSQPLSTKSRKTCNAIPHRGRTLTELQKNPGSSSENHGMAAEAAARTMGPPPWQQHDCRTSRETLFKVSCRQAEGSVPMHRDDWNCFWMDCWSSSARDMKQGKGSSCLRKLNPSLCTAAQRDLFVQGLWECNIRPDMPATPSLAGGLLPCTKRIV